MGTLFRLFFKRSNWALPYVVFLVIFVVLPLLLVILYAFQDAEGNFTLQNFVHFVNQPEVTHTFVYSVVIAVITTAICLLLGYPAAYIMSRMQSNSAVIVIMLFILPMWINMLIRTMATVTLFDFMQMPLGQGALIFGMVYNYLPFMIYPIYNTLQKMDHSLIEAAQDLGAAPRQVFRRVILPLSMPGVVSGIMMVLLPTISTFALAEMLTLNKIRLFGTIIQENINNTMWNYGAALSLIMLVIIGLTSIFTYRDKHDDINDAGLI